MPRLLLIEDDQSYAQVLLRRLQRHGWEGEHYEAVSAALSDAGVVDGVLLDQNLAGASHTASP